MKRLAWEVTHDAIFELDNLSAYLGKLKDMVCADGGMTPFTISSFNLQELVENVLRLIPVPPDKQVSFFHGICSRVAPYYSRSGAYGKYVM